MPARPTSAAVALLAVPLASCSVALPPVLAGPTVMPRDPILNGVARSCLGTLNGLREEARRSARARDIGVLVTAGMASSASVTSAAVPDSSAKMAASIVAAVSGFAGVLVNLRGSPTFPLERRSKAERHWEAALSVLELRPNADPEEDKALYAYAMAQLRECHSDNPSGKPPPPPLQTYLLKVDRVGDGVVRSVPGGIDCGDVCSGAFEAGRPITLRAFPRRTTVFSGWGGACAGTQGATCTVILRGQARAVVRFDVGMLPVRVTRSGTGDGTVVSSPGGIDCGATCQASFAGGSRVVLTPRPGPWSRFQGWSGCTFLEGESCVVRVDDERRVVAHFARRRHFLTVSLFGEGRVAAPSGAVDCGERCVASLAAGEALRLEAAAAPGWVFLGWAGACAGREPACEVRLDADRSVGARFGKRRLLTVTRSGEGAVSSQPAGIACGDTCAHRFDPGASVALQAAPAAGWAFGGWSGACAGTEPACTVTLDVDRAVSATFLPAPPPVPAPPAPGPPASAPVKP